MKFNKLLMFGAALALAAPCAFATPLTLDFTGSASLTSTGFTTSTTGPSGVATGTVTSGFGVGSTVHYTVPVLTGNQYAFHYYTGPNTPSVGSPIELFTFTTNGTTVDVFLTSILTGAVGESSSAFGTFTGSGYFTESGALTGTVPFTSITITDNSKGTGGTIQPFSGVITYATSLTPEPSSLALFGTGLLGLAGVARRKLRVS